MATIPSQKQRHPVKVSTEPAAVDVSYPLFIDTFNMKVLSGEPLERGNTTLPGTRRFRISDGVDIEVVVGNVSSKQTVKSRAGKKLFYGGGDLVQASPGLSADFLVRKVIERTLESLQEVRHRFAGLLTEEDFIREVGESLVDKATPSQEVPVEKGWQDLLEQGLRSKTALLGSKEFKSTSEASELLGIGEPAVRKRIREDKLFAMKTPGDGEHRIPAWALDPKIAGQTTACLLQDAEKLDEWHLYHFLVTPNGSFNGLTPFECLMSMENLPSSKRVAREELLIHLNQRVNSSLLEVVRQGLKLEIRESTGA